MKYKIDANVINELKEETTIETLDAILSGDLNAEDGQPFTTINETQISIMWSMIERDIYIRGLLMSIEDEIAVNHKQYLFTLKNINALIAILEKDKYRYARKMMLSFANNKRENTFERYITLDNRSHKILSTMLKSKNPLVLNELKQMQKQFGEESDMFSTMDIIKIAMESMDETFYENEFIDNKLIINMSSDYIESLIGFLESDLDAYDESVRDMLVGESRVEGALVPIPKALLLYLIGKDRVEEKIEALAENLRYAIAFEESGYVNM